MAEDSTKQNDRDKEKTEKESRKGFFKEVSEKVGGSLKAAGDAASDMTDDFKEKAGSFTGQLLDRLKKGTQDVLDLSAKFFDSVTVKANEYSEKYKDRVEMIRLKRERDELYHKLGSTLYDKKQELNLSLEEALQLDDLKEFIKEIDGKAKQIIEHGEHFDKKQTNTEG